MAADTREVVLIGPVKPDQSSRGSTRRAPFTRPWMRRSRRAFSSPGTRAMARAIACARGQIRRSAMLERFPKLEIVSSFGVGYDHVDVKYAAAHTISSSPIRPTVLTEEVADTALGLLLCTVRELPQAERYLRAGKWLEKAAIRSARRRCATAPSAWSAWAHRPGDCPAARSVRPAGRLSHAHSSGPSSLSALPEARRHGARRRYAHGHRARRHRRRRT